MPQKGAKPSLPKWQISEGALATLVNCENFDLPDFSQILLINDHPQLLYILVRILKKIFHVVLPL